MSCGTCSEKTKAAVSAATGAPVATGVLTRAPRQCPQCKRFVPKDGQCRRCPALTQGEPQADAQPVRRPPTPLVAGSGDEPDAQSAQPAHIVPRHKTSARAALPRVTADSLPLRCDSCGTFVGEEGACNNLLCPAKRAAPGVPSAENGWNWKRPDGKCPGDTLRRKYKIPLDATVEISESMYGSTELAEVGSGRGEIKFHDPAKRRGTWGADQEEFLDETEMAGALRLARKSGESGFVKIDGQEWDQSHPVIVNPLIEATGVDMAEIERQERGMTWKEPEAIGGEATFSVPQKWEQWNFHDDHDADKMRHFLKQFPLSRIDVPYNFTYHCPHDGDHDYTCQDGVQTPRQFAAHRLGVYGFGAQGHHPEAKRMAEQCGVTLVADAQCPMQPPVSGQGNPAYLFDYTVDGAPITGFAMDLNRHQVYAWPDDEREHKTGWDNMGVAIGSEVLRHNRQNMAIVHLNWKTKGTKRHDDLEVNMGAAGDEMTAEKARQAAATIATFAIRAGHDPEANIEYSVPNPKSPREPNKVKTTLREASAGHVARPAPPALRLTESGQQLKDAVLAPYAHWRANPPLDGTPGAKRAANQMAQAASSIRQAITDAGMKDGALSQDLTEFAEKKDEWAENFGGMLAAFSILKQRSHSLFRGDPKAWDRFGAGFVRAFGA